MSKHNKKAVVSFSGGKDSTLALYKALQDGFDIKYLFTTYNEETNRSWVHGIKKETLKKISDSLKIDLKVINTGSWNDYALDFEKALLEFKKEGIDTCIFGDIDVEDNRRWCEERCKNANLDSIFSLWKIERKDIAYEFVNSGFKALINVIDTKLLSDKFIAKELSIDLLEEIALSAADMCGENGEYHTVVFDGPIFSEKVDLSIGEKIQLDQAYVVVPVK